MKAPKVIAPVPESLPTSHVDYARERYAVAQAATYLNVSVKFLYELVGAKRIGFARMADTKVSKITFSQAALDAYAASRRFVPADNVTPMRAAAAHRATATAGDRRWRLGS